MVRFQDEDPNADNSRCSVRGLNGGDKKSSQGRKNNLNTVHSSTKNHSQGGKIANQNSDRQNGPTRRVVQEAVGMHREKTNRHGGSPKPPLNREGKINISCAC